MSKIRNTLMDRVGDRMDTDIVAGVNAGMRTVLVLTGVIQRSDVTAIPYQPTCTFDSIAGVGEILEEA